MTVENYKSMFRTLWPGSRAWMRLTSGVSVDGGSVSLRGNVESYSERTTTERVAARVYGLKGPGQ